MKNKNYKYIPLIKAYARQTEKNTKLAIEIEECLNFETQQIGCGGVAMQAIYTYLANSLCKNRSDAFSNINKNGFDRNASEADLVEIGYRKSTGLGRHTVHKKIDPSTAKSYKRYDTYEEVMDKYYPDTDEKIPEVA